MGNASLEFGLQLPSLTSLVHCCKIRTLIYNVLDHISLNLNSVFQRLLTLRYDDKFADYPDILADFYEWFQPRFDTLSSVLSYTREFVSACNINMAETSLENVDNDFHTDHADNDIRPEDSVSQVSLSHHGRRSVSRTSRSSKASSKTSSKASSHVSSIKSARIKESLRKVSLLAESQTLAKKQELMCKEQELSLARESLELSTNLAVATAKEEVLGC